MARWVIRLINHSPVTVDVDDERNLAHEFETFCTRRRTVLEWIRRRSTSHWPVTETMSLHADGVLTVQPAPERKRPDRKAIGFTR